MEVVPVENVYIVPFVADEHDWIHIFYICISVIFFVIEVFQRVSIDLLYSKNDLYSGTNVPSLNRYPTDFTPPFLIISISWYAVFIWQAVWMIYSIIGVFRRTSSGTRFYRHPCAMNKWCFFYTVFALILYTPQLAAAATNKYGIGISIFRYLGTFCEVMIIVVVVHLSLCKNLKDYFREKYFIDVWLTRLFYHNGLALWASLLFYESCLSIIIGLICSEIIVPSTACLIGCTLFLFGLIILSILENVVFSNALAFTLSPWFMFLWLLGAILFRGYDQHSSSLIVIWFVRFSFSLTCLLTFVRFTLFFWRYKQKLIPTFQSPRIYSLIIEPRPF